MQCCCSGCRAHCSVPERGCFAHAVDAVSHKVDAVGCDRRCSAHDCECSETAVIAVHMQCHFNCIQCPCSGCTAASIIWECRCSAQALDAVSHKWDAVCCGRGCSAHEGGCSEKDVDAVNIQRLQCTCSATSPECSAAAIVAEPTAESLNEDAASAL